MCNRQYILYIQFMLLLCVRHVNASEIGVDMFHPLSVETDTVIVIADRLHMMRGPRALEMSMNDLRIE